MAIRLKALSAPPAAPPNWRKYCRRLMSTPLRPAAPASPWAASQGRSAARRPALPAVAAPKPFNVDAAGIAHVAFMDGGMVGGFCLLSETLSFAH